MPRIDDSHQPFKRKSKIGPGPRKRPAIREAKDWQCRRAKPTKTHYVQICSWVGPGNRAPRKVKLKKSFKKRYNKQYRAWAARKAAPARGAKPGYRCRRTKTTRCR